MKKSGYGWICFFILFSPEVTTGQTDSAQEQIKPQFKMGVFYNSALNYYGRTDSLRSSGVFLLAELWADKNFYINIAPIFVMNKVTPFDYAGTLATTGYRFNNNNKIAGNVYLVKPFYKSNSQLVQSALKAQLASSFTSLNPICNITIGGDVKFCDKTDFGLSAGLDHIFRIQWPGGSLLVIDPSVYGNAGTQQFTRSYLKQGNFLLFPGVEQSVTEKANEFNILSWEFSAPFIYVKNKFRFFFTPSYVMPQNLVVVANRPDLSERGKRMFYATLGISAGF